MAWPGDSPIGRLAAVADDLSNGVDPGPGGPATVIPEVGQHTAAQEDRVYVGVSTDDLTARVDPQRGNERSKVGHRPVLPEEAMVTQHTVNRPCPDNLPGVVDRLAEGMKAAW